jgi:hypothetical protein
VGLKENNLPYFWSQKYIQSIPNQIPSLQGISHVTEGHISESMITEKIISSWGFQNTLRLNGGVVLRKRSHDQVLRYLNSWYRLLKAFWTQPSRTSPSIYSTVRCSLIHYILNILNILDVIFTNLSYKGITRWKHLEGICHLIYEIKYILKSCHVLLNVLPWKFLPQENRHIFLISSTSSMQPDSGVEGSTW